jgi:hypothetical protein
MFSFENWWVALGTAFLASVSAGALLRLVFGKPKTSMRVKIEYERHPEVRSSRRTKRVLSPPKSDG